MERSSSAGSKDKPGGVMFASTKDGRVYLHLSCAATLSRGKVALLAATLLVLLGYVFSPSIFGESNALKRRVRELEARMSKRVHWLLQHREHLQEHMRGGSAEWAPRRHADGRMHLLSHPDGISKLAEALAPATELPAFDDHYLCGTGAPTEGDVIKKKVALAAISWRAPKSLRNSMESWREGGLLDVVDERMIFLNSPTDEDRAIAEEFGFDVYTTDEHNGNVLVGVSGPCEGRRGAGWGVGWWTGERRRRESEASVLTAQMTFVVVSICSSPPTRSPPWRTWWATRRRTTSCSWRRTLCFRPRETRCSRRCTTAWRTWRGAWSCTGERCDEGRAGWAGGRHAQQGGTCGEKRGWRSCNLASCARIAQRPSPSTLLFRSLRGKTDFPAEGMPDCCAKSDPPNCPFHSKCVRRVGGGGGDGGRALAAETSGSRADAATARP
jgi:hypothetical protein